jgi:hypothetical protein
MTLEFDNHEITDEQLADASDFYDELEMHLDAMEDELDYHSLDELDGIIKRLRS